MNSVAKKIVVIGPFPPPIHGMAKNLKLFSDELAVTAEVINIDISPESINRGTKYHITKFVKVLKGLLALIKNCLSKRVAVIYMPPDAGFGAYYSLLYILIARTFNIPLFLHHRSFLYINKKTASMSLITKKQPKETCHVFLCQKMKDMFEQHYGTCADSLIVSNAQHAICKETIQGQNTALVIGHLSNLSFEKGLKQIFNTCRVLDDRRISYTLELAGPAENKETAVYIKNQIRELKSKVNYYGLIQGEQKDEFYSKVNVFLFPTQYRNEAQPNVIFEANACGIPVLTIDVGCITTDVDCNNGFVFKNQQDFDLGAPDVLEKLSQATNQFADLREKTLQKAKLESQKAKDNYSQLLSRLASLSR
jgi:glycosyltransferase involved in cell wall biosynthesis